jgi:uncharacterized RmlC-like cupin family protein
MHSDMRRRCIVVKASSAAEGITGLAYGAGISAESAGAERLCLQVVTIPPGARAKAHLHEGHESAAYVLAGEIVTWFGERLEEHVVSGPGDFVYVPAGVPHVPANYGSEPAVALLARSDPNEQESAVPLPELDELPHLGTRPS